MIGYSMRNWLIKPQNSRLMLICVVVVLAFSGCLSVKTTKNTATLLKTYENQSTNILIDKINKFQLITSLKANASARLTDLKLVEQGKTESYHPADAVMVLQRPAQIRLRIRVPFVRRTIADMTSDGQSFRIAVFYPDEYRRFLIGTNDRSYEDTLNKMPGQDRQKQEISSISKIRPQHLTEALLLKPIDTSDTSLRYFTANISREELEMLPNKPSRQVIRSYQILYLLHQNANNELKLMQEYWFDRSQPSLPLAHMQIFNLEGGITSEINYQQYQAINTGEFPHQVQIIRASDNYMLDITFDSLEANMPVAATAFTLDNSENLPEKNLDTLQAPVN